MPPLACALVVAATATAVAGGPTQKVTIETDPEGGTVYLNDVESGPVCTKPTPCTFDAPIGSYTLIVQKSGFTPVFEQLEVPKKPKKPLVFKYKLEAATATILIDNPAAKGATITIDDQPKGKVDAQGQAHVEVDPGGHQVTVTLGSKNLFEDFVTVDAGQEEKLKLATGKGKKVASGGDGGDGGDGDGGDDDKANGGEKPSGSVKASTPASTTSRYFSGGVIVDVGFRRFNYENPMAGPLAPEREDGQIIAGPAIEVWPTEILGLGMLHGLSIVARYELPINKQDVLDAMNQPLGGGTSTYWSSAEASLQYRWLFGDLALVAGGGYVMDELRFNTDAATDMKLPDASYQSLRIGGRASYRFGMIEPYLSIENRVVLDGGALASPQRFSTASATGVRGAIGVAAQLGHFVGRVEATDCHYSWTFTNDSAGNVYQADGATDKIYGVGFSLGYQY